MFRYETKLVTQAFRRNEVISCLRLHPESFVRAHPTRHVNSIYYDTPSLECLNDNLRGGAWRQKLRLRWYGQALQDVSAQLELKRKRGLVGDKKIFVFSEKVDLTNSWRELRQQLRGPLPLAWRLLLDEAVRPMLLNQYQREYFVSRDGAIRATLDYNQIAFDQRISSRPQTQYKLPLPDQLVIELKADETLTERLTEAANHIPMARIRNSKYVNGVLAAQI